MITMTRRLSFSAAHADWLPSLTQSENEALFGPEASPEPYGHNYVLDVSVIGNIQPQTGLLVNIKEIDRIVKAKIVQVLDHKYINQRIVRFETEPATSENLVTFIVEELEDQFPENVTLSAIHLQETPLHSITWLSHSAKTDTHNKIQEVKRNTVEMLLTRVYEFSASHRLHSQHLSDEENRELFGKCNYENGHGHNYELEITVAGSVDSRTGRVIEPGLLDSIIQREILDRYDHRHFNHDLPEFEGLITSAEVITRVIWERLETHIPAPCKLYRVLVRETPRNIFEYYGNSFGKDKEV